MRSMRYSFDHFYQLGSLQTVFSASYRIHMQIKNISGSYISTFSKYTAFGDSLHVFDFLSRHLESGLSKSCPASSLTTAFDTPNARIS